MSAAEPRVHPLFADELARLLHAGASLRAAGGLTAGERRAAYVASELEFMGWKVEPSHQRRHQIERGLL